MTEISKDPLNGKKDRLQNPLNKKDLSQFELDMIMEQEDD